MREFKEQSRRLFCQDGVSLSIQASEFHYSSPRQDKGPYSAVEVGYIEDQKGEEFKPPFSWKSYGDDGWPSSVYGYVPVALVNSV